MTYRLIGQTAKQYQPSGAGRQVTATDPAWSASTDNQAILPPVPPNSAVPGATYHRASINYETAKPGMAGKPVIKGNILSIRKLRELKILRYGSC